MSVKHGRRDLLKLFGLGAAIVPAVASAGGVEMVTATPAELAAFPTGPGNFWFPDLEIVADWMYSKATVPKNQLPSEIPFFAHALGTPIVDELGRAGWADIANTNVWRANQLPPPCHFAIESLGVIFSPLVEPGLRSVFSERYAIELMLGNKTYFRAPIAACFDVSESRTGIGASVDPVEGQDANRVKYPVTALRASIPLNVPIVLEPLQEFSVRAVGTPFRPSGKLSLWVYLQGRHARGRH